MKRAQKNPNRVNPKHAAFLASTWYVRWLTIAVVAVSYNFLPDVDTRAVTGLIVVAVVYNLLLKAAEKTVKDINSDRLLMITADTMMALVLLFFTGGIDSPYLPVLPFMIVTSAYWYGLAAALLLGLAQTVILGIQGMIVQADSITFETFLVKMVIFTSVGLYVAWMTKSERSERRQLLDLSSETEKERSQLRALIDNVDDAALVTDTAGRITLCNQAAFELLGLEQRAPSQPLKSLLSFSDAEGKTFDLNLKHVSEIYERKDLQLKLPDGSTMNAIIKVAPYVVDRHNHGFVLIIKDVSENKTLDQERREFIAVAAHELRTPLTIIQGNLSLLLSPELLPPNPEAVGLLNRALRSLKQLSHIINDLTNLSQVDNEQLQVDLEPLNPAVLIQELEADYKDQAQAKGLSLETKVDPDLSLPTVMTSRYVVQEILDALVSNAIKFSNKGKITLSIERLAGKPEGVTFSVSDQGIGISQSDQKKIFEKVFQSEDFMTRAHGGTGMGLYIAKKLAQRLTGELWFKSDFGKGSTFFLWVPPYSQHKKDRAKVASAEASELFSSL